MEKINLNKYLQREKEIDFIKNYLISWEKNSDTIVKKGIYVYGNPGSGKTTLINTILQELNYDVVKYDASDIRNTTIMDDITHTNMSNKNIMSLFYNDKKKIAIIMDEIDGMNSGDKGGINSLIKLIRPKKTKKQKLEKTCVNPIICIGNYRFDKKIKELMKVCNLVEITNPTNTKITNIINDFMNDIPLPIKNEIVLFVNGDLRKLEQIFQIYKNNKEILTVNLIQNVLQNKMYNNETKKITKNIFTIPYTINEHSTVMNETDRTSVGLLWHENIIDMIDTVNKDKSIPFYINQLNNICISDYIDRITFQNQIWQFNEMSSLIKTFKNAKMYHNSEFKNGNKNANHEIRFTKVLTKYSTEYNNLIFIQKLCQTLGMDKYDLIIFFISIKEKLDEQAILNLFENYDDISKLDINRMYRFIDKYIDENANNLKETEIEDIDVNSIEPEMEDF
jgi:hypothetical protein